MKLKALFALVAVLIGMGVNLLLSLLAFWVGGVWWGSLIVAAVGSLLIGGLLLSIWMLHKRVEFLEEKLDTLWKEMRKDEEI